MLPRPDDDRIGQHSYASDTQLEAALLTFPGSGRQRLRVLDCIEQAGTEGHTDEEVQDLCGLTQSSEHARRWELREDQWVRDSGRRRIQRSGRRAIVWVLTEWARELYSMVLDGMSNQERIATWQMLGTKKPLDAELTRLRKEARAIADELMQSSDPLLVRARECLRRFASIQVRKLNG